MDYNYRTYQEPYLRKTKDEVIRERITRELDACKSLLYHLKAASDQVVKDITHKEKELSKFV